MSVKDHYREEYKELLAFEYKTKSAKNFISYIKVIIKKTKEYKIIKIKLKIEMEGTKIVDEENFFS